MNFEHLDFEHCTLCHRPAEANRENDGYSSCCSDRICHSPKCVIVDGDHFDSRSDARIYVGVSS